MAEGKPHEDGVARLRSIQEEDGHQPVANNDTRGKGGFAFPHMESGGQLVQYIADLCTDDKDGHREIFEVDGQKPGQGHNSPYARAWDAHRSQFFWDNFRIPTIRFWTSELVGEGALDDGLIRQEIQFQRNYWLKNGRPTLK